MPSDAELDAALQVVRNEEIPPTAEAKEQYFMQNLGVGEQLSSQGMYTFPVPFQYLCIANDTLGLVLPAALSFFRAMRVYPEPLQLVMILERTLPEETFSIVMNLMSRDVSGPANTAESEGAESSAKGRRPKRKTRTGNSSSGTRSQSLMHLSHLLSPVYPQKAHRLLSSTRQRIL
jgi:hypothetical protein